MTDGSSVRGNVDLNWVRKVFQIIRCLVYLSVLYDNLLSSLPHSISILIFFLTLSPFLKKYRDHDREIERQ
jgi:hypothetical protein